MTQAVFESRATLESWDDDYYQPIAERFYDRAIARMLRLLDAKPGDLVLDAGCGPGVHSVRAAKHGMRVHAIDLSETMLEEARRRSQSAGVADAITFNQADLTKLDFDDCSFDRVFSWGVVIHIPQLNDAIDELTRIVKPGGRLALYVTNAGALDHKIESLARLALRKPGVELKDETLGRGFWCDMHGQKLWVWRMDIAALTQRIEYNGFRRIHRVCGEFTEIQRRLGGVSRNMLLRFNNLWFNMHLPAALGSANLLVFEKQLGA